MSAKDVRFSIDARTQMLRGVEILNNAVKAGDRVLFGKWSGTEVKLEGEDLLIMKESDLLGVIEGAPALVKAV